MSNQQTSTPLTRPRVSLLISTYNWERALDLVLIALRAQTVMPDEVLIADDGSTEATRAIVEHHRAQLPIPLVHVWQEDDGFRKGEIINKAIAQATGDYVISIDGDMIMERHFIADHLELMQPGYYVCGSRVKLREEASQALLASGSLEGVGAGFAWSHNFNSLRSRLLRHFLAERYKRPIICMRGCNFAFWRADYIRINGYDEDISGWGSEDSDLVFRLHFAGVKKKFLKMGGVAYHLYHREFSKDRLAHNNVILRETITTMRSRCARGIDKYL